MSFPGSVAKKMAEEMEWADMEHLVYRNGFGVNILLDSKLFSSALPLSEGVMFTKTGTCKSYTSAFNLSRYRFKYEIFHGEQLGICMNLLYYYICTFLQFSYSTQILISFINYCGESPVIF